MNTTNTQPPITHILWTITTRRDRCGNTHTAARLVPVADRDAEVVWVSESSPKARMEAINRICKADGNESIRNAAVGIYSICVFSATMPQYRAWAKAVQS